MDEFQINDASNKIVAQVIATTASLNDQWDEVLMTKFNIEIIPEVHNKTWLEIAFFGAYTLLQRAKTAYSADDYEKISQEFHRALVRMILMVVFTQDGDDEKTKKSLELYVTSEFNKSFELYKKHSGDTALVLRDLIRDAFNSSEISKIKFVDDGWKNKLKLNVAFALGDADFQAKHKDVQFLKNDFLMPVVQVFANTFRTLDQSEFI
jgi:hypothetical protein